MSLFYLVLVCIVGFLMSLLALILQYKHLLSILLSLEGMAINLFVMLFVLLNNITLAGEGSFIFITLGACEASLGLAILVSMIRVRGNDYVSSFSSQKC
uniref:NADH-ubiquinone oxidoreductase chain 4L n=1 Tax=Margarya melanioides TaxID=888545 RepID=A0A219YR42_9CAEN|nr:NADH dehydrogenase subunit 4L [Margarya melanioides]AQT38731.1 NADH dehydrogenase subunit 4L [Margarya melanioides]